MAKFIRVSSGASGMTNEGVYFSVKDIIKVSSLDSSSIITFKENTPAVQLNTSENSGEAIIDHLAHSKSSVIDIASMGRGVLGIYIPRLTLGSEVADTAVTAGSDITFTLGGAIVGVKYVATLSQGEGESLITSVVSGAISAADEAITFTAAETSEFEAGAATLNLEFSTPNQPENIYAYEHDVTLS